LFCFGNCTLKLPNGLFGFNTTAIGMVVIDETGRIEEFNPACETIFGYSQQEIIGQKINRLMPEPYSIEHDGYLKRYLATGKSTFLGTERELTGLAKGDRLFPLELHVGEANLGERRVFVGFVKDITARKEMEAKSRHFEAMVQSSDDAIMSKTLDGIVTSWNASAENMFGYRAEEMIGKPMVKLFPPERINEEKFILEQIAQGHRVNHFETMRIRKDGSPIEVSVTLSPILDASGKVVGASKIARDISPSKQLERELQAAKQAAEAASHAKSEFLANMSHEIRTPMNAVIGLTRLVLETDMTAKQQDYLQKIQRSSRALLAILNDILDLSKIESGRMEVDCTEFSPTQLLQGVADLFAARIEEKGLELFLDIATEIPATAVSDPLRIQQVLSNLVSNAIKFTEKGEIDIRMDLLESGADDMLLHIQVRDTGIGISESAIQQLFQPFSQLDTSITRKYGGTGLGLVISKHLVEMLGGSISVSSMPGQGSTFSFSVRCGKGRQYNWGKDSYRLKGTRVLVVDDQDTSCVILRRLLESWDFTVETSLSALEGLRMIRAAENTGTPFDLLLLDWKMDGMNGLDLAIELGKEQAENRLKRQPVVVMVTAYDKELLVREATGCSARIDGFLTKPIVPSALLNTILTVYHYREVEHDRKIEHAKAGPYEAARPLLNARVLLVEDNELNRQVASEFLNKAGLRVSVACHGGEAVHHVQTEKFDAVLMDLQMPEMDGFEAARRIRQLPAGKSLPIIAMTAAVMNEDKEACLAAGMNDHISKPIDPQAVIDALLRWIKPNGDGLAMQSSPSKTEDWADLQALLPGFDLSNAMLIFSDDKQQFVNMLNDFCRQFCEEGAIIAEQINSGELETAEKRLHKLKGVTGNLGASDLFLASKALDTQLQNGSLDGKVFDHWLETFNNTMSLLAGINSESFCNSSASQGDGTSLRSVLEVLDSALAQDSFVDDKLLVRLKALLPKEQQSAYDELNKLIIATDYTEARKVLKTVLDQLNAKS
jgi:PAS domain S-box-containing protein